jgi:hypothetical protein
MGQEPPSGATKPQKVTRFLTMTDTRGSPRNHPVKEKREIYFLRRGASTFSCSRSI